MRSKRSHMYHNLSVMLEAGIPLEKSLRTAASGMRGPMSKTFTSLADGVSGGTKMSESMEQKPRLFAPLDVRLVQVGETTGNLAESIENLSQWYQFKDRMLKIFTSGMLMPLMVFHVAAFLIPFITFAKSGLEDGRTYTTSVISWLASLYIPALIIFLIIRFARRKGVYRRMLDWAVLRVPLLGGALKFLALSRFLRAFHMFYKAGVPIVDASAMAADVTGNIVIAGLVEGGAQSAARGERVSEGLSVGLPPEMIEMWRVGEESGTLEEVTGRLTASTTDTAERKFKAFAEWLPRVIYFIICIFVIKAIVTGWADMYSSLPGIG